MAKKSHNKSQHLSPPHLHGIRALLLATLVFALFLGRTDMPLAAPIKEGGEVLSYSTDISKDSLLDSTNSTRTETGHSTLKGSNKLDASAQAKAEDMIKQNYWSHEAPDGTQPWVFFKEQDYAYEKAGENLAYGFANSDATIAAWMNSPSHRKNLLGEYKEVGFGIASGKFQKGHYTVIVAHYGTPATGMNFASSESNTSGLAGITTGAVASVTSAQQLLTGNAPTVLVMSLVLCAAAAVMFAVTHRRLFAHAAVSGERLAIAHPIFDTAFVIAITVLLLISTRGMIG